MGTNLQGYHLLWPDLPTFSQLQFPAPLRLRNRPKWLESLLRKPLLVFPSSNPEWNLAKKKWTLCWGFSSCLFFFKPPIRSRSPLLTGSRLISLPLATQMFQFAKFEKSKERRLATELGYGFPIGDPWITDGISPWPFASESVLPSQCPGIHPMHSFRSCTKVHWTPQQISTKNIYKSTSKYSYYNNLRERTLCH